MYKSSQNASSVNPMNLSPETQTEIPPVVAPAVAPRTDWSCQVCTLINPMSATRCGVCNNARPADVTPEVAGTDVKTDEKSGGSDNKDNAFPPLFTVGEKVTAFYRGNNTKHGATVAAVNQQIFYG